MVHKGVKRARIRTGGDEFLCILPRTDEAALRAYGAKLTETAKMFSIKDRFLGVSFGTAVARSKADDIRECIAKSDQAMYRNKKAKNPGCDNSFSECRAPSRRGGMALCIHVQFSASSASIK